MNWHQDMTVIDGRLYSGDRWLGSFSSHGAALEGLQLKRDQIREHKCKSLTEDDHDLLEVIDMDEV